MRTDPELREIIAGPRGMLQGIQACIERQCLVSAVALIYSSIDSLAALTRPITKPDTTRVEFICWTNKYFLPGSNLSCSAEDLYGARCGVIHTYSPDSTLRRGGTAKPLIYYWAAGPLPDATIPLPIDAIVVAIEDLTSALEQAVYMFLGEIDDESNMDLVKCVNHHQEELLCYKPYM